MNKSSAPDDSQETYTIRRLTREFGVTSRAIRFYETKGMLSPTRRGITRIFSRRDRTRLKLILRGKRVGFPLSEIKQMIDLYDQTGGVIMQRKLALAKGRRQMELLKTQREQIDSAIDELEEMCRVLEAECESERNAENGN